MSDSNFSDVVLLLHADGDATPIVDSSSRAFTISTGGAGTVEVISSQYKFGDGSLDLPGNGYALVPASDDDLVWGTSDFTIEFWIRSTQSSGSWSGVIGTTRSSTVAGVWTITNRGSGLNQITFSCRDLDWRDIALGTGSNPNDGNWHHIAFTRESNVFRGFFDGVLKATYSGTRPIGVSGRGLHIGWNQGDNAYFTGQLDDVRLTYGVARYTADFTVPSEAFYTPVLYYVIGPSSGWSDPSAAEIKAGTLSGGGAATASGSETANTSSGVQTFATPASGLSAGTSYKIAFVWSDGSNDSNVTVSDAWETASAATDYPYTGTGTITTGGVATTSTLKVYAFSGTGTITTGGAAAVLKQKAYPTSGTITTGGAATTLKAATFTYVASGLAQTSGSALAAKVKTYTGIGGAVASGISPVAVWKVVSGAGGVTSGGSAGISITHAFGASGTITTGGAATTSLSAGGIYTYVGSGTITTGGAAVLQKTKDFDGSGGIVTGGAASTNFGGTFAYTGSGGIVTGGAATTSFAGTFAYVGSGTATTGGAASTEFVSAGYTGSGGIITGGEAPHAHENVLVGSGGIITGGEAPVEFSGTTSFDVSVCRTAIVYPDSLTASVPEESRVATVEAESRTATLLSCY